MRNIASTTKERISSCEMWGDVRGNLKGNIIQERAVTYKNKLG